MQQNAIRAEGGAAARSINDNRSAIAITLTNHGDRTANNGAALTVSDITILANPGSFEFA